MASNTEWKTYTVEELTALPAGTILAAEGVARKRWTKTVPGYWYAPKRPLLSSEMAQVIGTNVFAVVGHHNW